MRSQLKNERDLNHGPLEPKASVLVLMGYADPCIINNNKHVYLNGASIVSKYC